MNTSSFKSCAHSSYYTSYFIRIVCVHDSCRSHYESMVYSSSCCRNYAYHGIYVILWLSLSTVAIYLVPIHHIYVIIVIHLYISCMSYVYVHHVYFNSYETIHLLLNAHIICLGNKLSSSWYTRIPYCAYVYVMLCYYFGWLNIMCNNVIIVRTYVIVYLCFYTLLWTYYLWCYSDCL